MSPKTPDRFPGRREEEELILDPSDSPSDVEGLIKYYNGAFSLRDASGEYNPHTGQSGLAVDNIVWDVAGGIVYDNTDIAVMKE